MQAGGENERPPNDGAGVGLILQQLNMFFERQEQFNERLEQRIVAFEEQSEKGRERKASKRLPKALTVSSNVLHFEIFKNILLL